ASGTFAPRARGPRRGANRHAPFGVLHHVAGSISRPFPSSAPVPPNTRGCRARLKIGGFCKSRSVVTSSRCLAEWPTRRSTTVSFQELSAGSRADFVVDIPSRSCRETGRPPAQYHAEQLRRAAPSTIHSAGGRPPARATTPPPRPPRETRERGGPIDSPPGGAPPLGLPYTRARGGPARPAPLAWAHSR